MSIFNKTDYILIVEAFRNVFQRRRSKVLLLDILEDWARQSIIFLSLFFYIVIISIFSFSLNYVTCYLYFIIAK